MYTSSLAFVCDGHFSIENKSGHREFDRQRHEHRRGIVDEQGCSECYAQVGVPRDVKVQLQVRLVVLRLR